MGEERLRYIRDLQSLVPLHEHTDAIGISEEGRVEVLTKLSPPLDEFGIPRPEIMVEQLLARMTTPNYIWPGKFDEHHLATPKADFTVVRTNDEGDVGSAFRGLSCLKIELPRQMHNFSHALFELPGRPSVDVMRQAVIEVGQARQLQSIINEYLPGYHQSPSERENRLCIGALQASIESMREPEVGMLPPLEELAGMEINDLRRTVTMLLRVRRFSTKRLIHPAIRKNGQLSGSKKAA